MQLADIPLSKIIADPATQPRNAILTAKIEEYVEDMNRGDKFPPLVVFKHGAKYNLADGFHRYFAAVTCQVETFQCEVREGTLRDAILYSCGANAAHGLRRTTADKRRAVVRLLEDKEWASWSNHEIARRCAVSDTFVGQIRKEFDRATTNVGSEDRTYTTKHGGTSTMNTAAIGRRQGLPDLEPQTLAKALREIERNIDMLPDAEEFVARFPDDQWYFFPHSKLEEMASWLTGVAAAWRNRIVAKANERTTETA